MWFNREQILVILLFVIFIIISPILLEKNIYTSFNNLNGDKNLKNDFSSPLFFLKEKKFYVEIKGAVKNPGKYLVESGTRYFDLIQLAGGFTNKAKTSHIKKNYYLKNGQIFTIPFKDQFVKTKWIEVEIRGAILKPGIYKIKSGERFFKLLQKAGGFTLNADKRRKYKNYMLKDGQSFYVYYRKTLPVKE
ncbi:MAG: SLBB domain-containing protein [Spirochaetota bacterium]|nr:SLBB domain-containing protein [Spirochaetota bacterium]